MALYAMPGIYDILHTPGSQAEARALERIASRHGLRPWKRLRCLEPACGSGRLLRLLERRGARVLGFDREPSMLAYARRRLGRSSQLFVADMDDFATELQAGSIHLAFNLINSIRHLETAGSLRAHLQQMAAVLRSNGLYVVGLSLSRYGEEFPTEDQWRGRRGRCEVHQLVQYLPPAPGDRFEEVISHLTVRRPRGDEHFDERYRLRCYDRQQWQRELASSALRILEECDENGRPLGTAIGDYRLFVLGSP